ncbi:MAG TPA: lipase maturation factor family protein, partial [Puia sp.]|nr:lipase maturation factor family protein [Puia sp.]
PWFVFWPRIGRQIAGIIIILLQIMLIFSGNLSMLNWMTIIPALACFDDGFWARILPRSLVTRAEAANDGAEPSRPMTITAWVVTALIAVLSIAPTFNLLSPGQIMNTSFDPLDLVNTYGAFGSVGRERMNVVFEGSGADSLSDSTHWVPYHYKGLPVDLDKRPPQIAPYQPRLDWQMWFAAMSSPEEYPWTINLVSKLLHNDPGALSLFADNPFPAKPPRYIRAVLYKYSFLPPNPGGLFWKREYIGEWLLPLSVDDPRLTESLKREGWTP